MFTQFRPGDLIDGRIWYELSTETEQMQTALLGLFCVAIAEFEGFYIPDSISDRNNNPGNIRPVGGTGFRTFETELQGWEALKDQVMRNINRGLTLVEFFLGKDGVYPGYAPLADNDPVVMDNYINFVANRCSFSKSLDLRYYFPAIANVEGSSIPVQGMLYAYKPFEGF